jgi:hypothetical protein
MISLYWNNDDALDSGVREYFQTLRSINLPSSEYSLIMTDTSANQFLFEENKITACVDLNAYVIGPKEWELALIENCVKDIDSFKKGYEQYQPLPGLDGTREFYIFMMALCDIWEKQEMKNFFNKFYLS